MMYLSRLALNLRHRGVQRDLADRYELHRNLMAAFNPDLPGWERVLYRVEADHERSAQIILVQSLTAPDWRRAERLKQPNYLLSVPDAREVTPSLAEGLRTRFRLQANPTVKREGKRHALYAEPELLNWLVRKSEQHGFRVGGLDVRINKLGNVHGKRHQQTWHAVQFDGVLTVTHPDAFRDALVHGIGSAKAFGFGLLSVPYTAQ